MTAAFLTRKKAYIFRIVHRSNVPAMLADGLHCRNSHAAKRPFTQIGNLELIGKRLSRQVDCAPWGTLADYVPFYFTPFSPMLFNIRTGYNGVTKCSNQDIVIFVSSLHKLIERGVRFVFSDRHAYLRIARFSADLEDLAWIDWTSLRRRNFKNDDIDRFERYQAEALVHKHMPISALLGVACYNSTVQAEVEREVASNQLALRVLTKKEWYFP